MNFLMNLNAVPCVQFELYMPAGDLIVRRFKSNLRSDAPPRSVYDFHKMYGIRVYYCLERFYEHP